MLKFPALELTVSEVRSASKDGEPVLGDVRDGQGGDVAVVEAAQQARFTNKSSGLCTVGRLYARTATSLPRFSGAC